jgi:hypothetical protein
MKTRTFARLALLIPLLVWVISLLLLLSAFAFFPDSETTSETPTLVAGAEMLLLFYIIGIIYWLIPYLLVSLGLLFVSFLSKERILKAAYLLSPILMAIVIMIMVTTITTLPLEGSLPISDLTSNFRDSIGAGGLFAIIALIWGYICVGLGFGVYKLLQHFRMIKEDEKIYTEINSEIIGVNG